MISIWYQIDTRFFSIVDKEKIDGNMKYHLDPTLGMPDWDISVTSSPTRSRCQLESTWDSHLSSLDISRCHLDMSREGEEVYLLY